METVTSTHDLILYGLPLIVILLVVMFRLDELFGAGKNQKPAENERRAILRRSMTSDPDGRPWSA